ncbi:Uncharacterised protein [uncultured archaeon]|nr:Uncharacterised protein [uncultured archaeon]
MLKVGDYAKFECDWDTSLIGIITERNSKEYSIQCYSFRYMKECGAIEDFVFSRDVNDSTVLKISQEEFVMRFFANG